MTPQCQLIADIDYRTEEMTTGMFVVNTGPTVSFDPNDKTFYKHLFDYSTLFEPCSQHIPTPSPSPSHPAVVPQSNEP